MTMTRERIEELKHKAAKTTAGFMLMVWPEELSEVLALAERALQTEDLRAVIKDCADEQFAELGRIAMRFVDRAGDVHPGVDDAERICREFHQAMSDAIDANFEGRALQPEEGQSCEMTPEQMTAYAQSIADRASQLALPAGPVPEGLVLVPMHLNAEMRDVLSEEDWTWEDLLVAANAVTEEQYYAIQSGDGESPAVAQPVADEREAFERAAGKEGEHDARFVKNFGSDVYFQPHIKSMWEGWQLARAALCQPAEEGGKVE